MTFYAEYEMARLRPASYNPRHIDNTSFVKLQASIRSLGLIKPIIATTSGTILAGHQRTKAMTALGLTHCPAFILQDISMQDEIRFNQLHNISDLDLGENALRIPPRSTLGYIDIASKNIMGNFIARNATRKDEILRLLTKHGSWGSIIATQSGEILVSKLYAIASKTLNIPCKAYIVRDEQKEEVLTYFGQQYGVFSYQHLPKTTWAQSLAQMMRLRNDATDNKGGHSRTYEGLVMPRIHKNMRVLDFGAGQMDHVKKLQALEYAIRGIEFYFRKGSLLDVGQVHRDITALCEDLQVHGRYDLVICDSVLNSVDSLQAESDVLICLSAFCKVNGSIIFSGRSRDNADYRQDMIKRKLDHDKRNVNFIDDNGFSAMFSKGVWRYQKFHTAQQIRDLAQRYYGTSFQLYDLGNCSTPVQDKILSPSWGVVACKTKELPLEQRKEALGREFDLSLPEGRRYGRSCDILRAYEVSLLLED